MLCPKASGHTRISSTPRKFEHGVHQVESADAVFQISIPRTRSIWFMGCSSHWSLVAYWAASCVEWERTPCPNRWCWFQSISASPEWPMQKIRWGSILIGWREWGEDSPMDWLIDWLKRALTDRLRAFDAELRSTWCCPWQRLPPTCGYRYL